MKEFLYMAKGKSASVNFDRKTNSFIGIEQAVMTQLIETYEGIDVRKELGKMSLWLMSDKGIKRKGEIGFILNWLNNAKPSFGTNSQLDLIESDTPLGHLLKDYLEDLWKNSEHIHQLNKIRYTS